MEPVKSAEKSELIKAFEANWSATAGAFCEEFKLDKKQFRKWLKGRSRFDAGESAVKSFLEQLSKGERKLGVERNRTEPLKLEQLEQFLTSLSAKLEVNTLILFQEDFGFEQLRKMEWLLPEEKNQPNFYVLAFLTSRSAVPIWCRDNYWRSFVVVEPALPTILDYAVGVQANNWISMRKDMSAPAFVYLFGREKFADTMSRVISSAKKIPCQAIDPMLASLSLTYLMTTTNSLPPLGLRVKEVITNFLQSSDSTNLDELTKELNQLFDASNFPFESDLLDKHLSFLRGLLSQKFKPAEMKKILSPAAPTFSPVVGKQDLLVHPILLQLKEELTTRPVITLQEIGNKCPATDLGYKNWFHLLSLPTVQNLLNADYIPVSSDNPTPIVKSRLFSRPKQSQTEDEKLRKCWHLLWKGTIQEFCQRYHCDQGSFSAWLHEKRQSSPLSVAAIKRWLSEVN